MVIVTGTHAAPNLNPIPHTISTKIRETTISVRSPSPHTLRPRGGGGVPSDNDLEALKQTLAPLTPGWEVEPHVFFAARDDNPLNPRVAQALQSFYEDILGYASTTTNAATGWFQAKTEAFRFEMESTIVQNGVNAPSAFLGWKLVQSFGNRMLEWTKRKNLYGSKCFYIWAFPNPGDVNVVELYMIFLSWEVSTIFTSCVGGNTR